MDNSKLTYEQFHKILRQERLPAAIINMDALDLNCEKIFEPVRPTGKMLRIASKSIRSIPLLRYIMEKDRQLCRGLMCFSVEEAAFCAEQGFDDLLVAYPSVQPSDMKLLGELTAAGKRVMLMADSELHLDAIAAAGRRAKTTCLAVIDIDVSYRPLGGKVHMGVRRSPVRSGERAAELARYSKKKKGLRIVGAMGYEAQIAGLTDDNPFTRKLNPIKKAIRKISVSDVAARRKAATEAMVAEGVKLELVNGGGTGSIYSTTVDDVVTEVTAGSGFFCSHLFSYYNDVKLLPAAFFALQVVRISDPGLVTCHGGGYIASGETGPDRQPIVHLPQDCTLIGLEGGGEVQTPIVLGKSAPELSPGDPVIMRHAKAGELCERFNELILISKGKISDRVPTYRGQGKCFL
jgi:D-serine deaminase-like pyridoxal phosphate-dependent protein